MTFVNFVNESGMIWSLTLASADVTGSIFLTMLLTVLFFIFLCMLFRMPLWASAMFVLPYMIMVLSFSADFLPVVGVMLLYLGLILAEVFIIK